MITKELEETINRAYEEARKRKHEYVTLEHLLYAMLDDPASAKVLEACGVDFDELDGGLEGVFSDMEVITRGIEPEQHCAGRRGAGRSCSCSAPRERAWCAPRSAPRRSGSFRNRISVHPA